MKDVEIIGMLKSYISATLVGMGAQKGAPCTVKSVVDEAPTHTITLEWTDEEGEKHTKEVVLTDGADGAKGDTGATGQTGPAGPSGSAGADGYSPTISVKTSTDSEYVLTITDKNGSVDTPNLKGQNGKVVSISVNGVAQTISEGAVNLDVAGNLITDTQWADITALYA